MRLFWGTGEDGIGKCPIHQNSCYQETSSTTNWKPRATHNTCIASYCRPSNEFTAKPWSFDGGSRLKAKWNWKIICERIADQKRIFCYIIENGKFRTFPWSCWSGLALQNRILLQYQHLLSPQFNLPAHDLNTQTLYPFSHRAKRYTY